MFVSQLTCWDCGLTYRPNALHNLCTCGKPLRVDYDLKAAGKALSSTQERAGRSPRSNLPNRSAILRSLHDREVKVHPRSEILLMMWRDAESLASLMRLSGWTVATETRDHHRGVLWTISHRPRAVVISLHCGAGLSIQGAYALHLLPATTNVPVILVDGDPEAIAEAKRLVPSARWTTTDKLNDLLSSTLLR